MKLVNLPQEYKDSSTYVDTMHEEDALCWLWAFPDIFPWPNPVAWLYTPVTGNSRWPGDLWGVDSAGNLLIIEAKQCKRLDNPFSDFVNYHKSSREELTAAHWQRKWDKHYNAELSSPNGWSERPPGKTDGILPRSNRRSHIRRWASLSGIIDDQIRAPQYALTVKKYLQVRYKQIDPTPCYLALMIETNPNHPILTKDAKESANELQKMTGIHQVGVIAIHCRIISHDQGIVEARGIDREEWVSTSKTTLS